MHNLLCAAFARLVRCKFFYIGLGAMVLMELYTMLTERYGIQQFGDGLEKAFFQYPMAVTLIVPAFCGLFVGEEYSGGTLPTRSSPAYPEAVFISPICCCPCLPHCASRLRPC